MINPADVDSFFKKYFLKMSPIFVGSSYIGNQSYYIEVAEWGASSRAIQNWLWIYLAYFLPKKKFYKRDIMQLFSADASVLKKIKKNFAYENMKKTA